ncbi:MAG: hypothetical protein K5683_07060 [Prevotella sp.]|nr:hypothetical protein [Prevotella sp.]
MKRLLRKTIWRTWLLILALMVVPKLAQAYEVTSTVTGVVNGNYGPEITTDEGANWIVNDGISLYNENNSTVVLSVDGESATGLVSLTSMYSLTGEIISVEIDGYSSTDNASVSFKVQDISSQDPDSYIEKGTITLGTSMNTYTLDFKEPVVVGGVGYDEYLRFVYNPGNTTDNICIRKITIRMVSPYLSVFVWNQKFDVNNVNCERPVEDFPMSFNPTDSTLIFYKNYNGCELGCDTMAIKSYIPRLKIHLGGDVTMQSNNRFIVFDSPETAETLTFTTDENNPGSLTFERYSDFTDVPKEDSLVVFYNKHDPVYLNNLQLTQGTDNFTVSTQAVINPIINKEDISVEEVFSNATPASYSNLDGVVINNVLYTLNDEQGYFYTSDGEKENVSGGTAAAGIVLKVGMTDEEVSALDGLMPGCTAFNDAFKGMTMMLPAGTNYFSIDMEGDGELHARVAATTLTLTKGATYKVVSTTPVALLIYQLDKESNASRANGPRHEKVQTTSVKVTGYKANSSALINTVGFNQTASVYALSAVGYDPTTPYVEMSTLSVSSSAEAGSAQAPARSVDAPLMSGGSEKEYVISELGADVFDEITDKSFIRYVDLSGTIVKDMWVDRSIDYNVFYGFPDATYIYLPKENNANDQPNVIVDGVCNELTLDEGNTFMAPAAISFKAATVTLNRTFTAGKKATVFLPFSIPADQASVLGTFHTFKEISGDAALFNDPESSDIADNTPYIFVPAADATNLVAHDVSVNGLGSPSASNGELYGTFKRIDWTTDPTDIYGFAAKTENGLEQGQFFKVKAGSFVPPFRAYLKVSGAPARLRVVIGDDEVTGITTIADDATESNVWYSLDGQLHQGTPRQQGIYIHNNKKVIVK